MSSNIKLAHDATGVYDGSWGISKEFAEKATRRDYLKRAGQFAAGGTGYKRELWDNIRGIVTERQAQQKGFGAFLNRAGIKSGSVFMLATSFGKGGGGVKDLASQTLGFGAASLGFRTAQNLGGVAFKGASRGAGIARNMIGGIGGLAAGIAIGGGVYMAMEAGQNSNNMISKMASEASSSDFRAKFTSNRNTLTARQRGLQQISKSALNNRGQLLGMEASVLNGF